MRSVARTECLPDFAIRLSACQAANAHARLNVGIGAIPGHAPRRANVDPFFLWPSPETPIQVVPNPRPRRQSLWADCFLCLPERRRVLHPSAVRLDRPDSRGEQL